MIENYWGLEINNKYFQDKVWVATVDYGNGELDSIGVKTTKDGDYTFDMSEKK